MPSFNPRDVHFPEDGQTVIELGHPYVKGEHQLMVYLNGVLVVADEDYLETDNFNITFKYQLSADDVVVTQHLVMFKDKIVRVIADKAGLFQRYGAEDRLKENQKYTMTMRYGDKEFESKFSTRISPQYAPVATIRSDLGKFISGITDFQIQYMIYENSLLASTMFEDFFDIDEETGLGTLNTTDGVIPYKVRQFVRYRTEVYLITQIYLILMGQSGSDHMVLGQLEVEKRANLGDYEPLLRSIKAELTKYSRTRSPVVSAVKGGPNSYPLNTPRNGMETVFSDG